MTITRPRTFRGELIRHALRRCELGTVHVAATDRGVCGVVLGGDAAEAEVGLRGMFPHADLTADHGGLADTLDGVLARITDSAAAFAGPLDVRGTDFQRRVWGALGEIPSGRTVTYAELAASAGRPKAVRAAANACGANRLAVLIPCHRVVRTGGGLGGFRWGVERKRALLERERRWAAG